MGDINQDIHNLTKEKVPLIVEKIAQIGLNFIPSTYNNLDRIYDFQKSHTNFKTKITKYLKTKIPSFNSNNKTYKTIQKQLSKNLLKYDEECNVRKNKPNLKYNDFIKIKELKNTHNDKILIPTDKNLGPAWIEKTKFHNLTIAFLQKNNNLFKKINTQNETITNEINKNWKHFIKNESMHTIPKQVIINQTIVINENKWTYPKLEPLLKIHKKELGVRPLIRYVNYISTPFAKYLSNIFNDTLNLLQNKYNTPTVINNSQSIIINIENKKLNDDFTFITADISNMYTSLKLNDIKTQLTQSLSMAGYNHIFIELILQILNMCQTYSYFMFENELWQQINGLLMGINYAPGCANLVLWVYEFNNKILWDKCLWFFRYIDDVQFAIIKKQKHNHDITFNNIQKMLNQIYPSYLSFEFEINNEQTNFLDLTMTKIQCNNNNNENKNKNDSKNVYNIKFSLYEKPNNKHNYVYYNSNHPKHIKDNIIYNMLLRAVVRCSDINDYQTYKQKLFNNLLKRGFSPYIIRKAKKPSYFQRNIILNKLKHNINDKNNNDKQSNKIYFLRKYSNIYDNSKYFYKYIEPIVDQINKTYKIKLEVVIAYKLQRKIISFLK